MGMNKGSAFSEKFLNILASSTLFQDAIRPFIAPKVAYLKDVKTSGISGGDFTAGVWHSRILNVISGDSGFVSFDTEGGTRTSGVDGNTRRFILQPGKYLVEASAPAFNVRRNRIKMRNITDSLDQILGASGAYFDAVGNGIGGAAELKGTIIVTDAKAFEIQHRCELTRNIEGLGLASNFGENEVHTQVKITKLY